jgi:crotonobetainyl-CoA:carnitine CoA-transferase CaiB-like acyl-CoA transferase/citrate lyase beta subunit
MSDHRPGALDGIRVLDTATLIAGPMVGTYLGELGAEVIKVEQPDVGDPLRTWGDAKDGTGLVWKSVSRNKRCITLDLRQQAGQGLLEGLAQLSDVLILGSRPSALARWGLTPADVLARHPHLIVLHVSGYGAGGPSSDRPGYGTLAEAMSGFAHLVGEPDRPPSLPPFMLADGVAALAATQAVLAALYHRDAMGGAGQVIDVNLIEPLARLIESATLSYDQLGVIPQRCGSRFDASAPRNCYQTQDGHWLAVSSASPRMAQRVFTVVGRPDLAENPEYYTPTGRLAHGDEIDKAVASWISARSAAEVIELFEANDCAIARVYDASDLLADPHLQARGTFRAVPDSDLGSVRVQAPAARLSTTPALVRHLGRALGADNDFVYGDLLGLDEPAREQLRANRTILGGDMNDTHFADSSGCVRRSELATPASNLKMLAQSVQSGADLVFMDLEDACAPSVKEAARQNVITMLNDYDWGRTKRAVRVNGLDTVWCHDDVVEVVTGAGANLDVIIVPKARSARDVWWFDVLLSQLEAKLGLPNRIGLEVLIEEAEGLERALEIASASPRLEAVILGVGDLSASLHARVDTNFQPLVPYPGDFWHYARTKVVAAARAAGIAAIDYPYPDFQDLDGYRADCEMAGALGFDGKWCIHPTQIPIANESFTPSQEEMDWALAAQDAYRSAQGGGTGAIAVDGKLVDAAHMRHVEIILRRAGQAVEAGT